MWATGNFPNYTGKLSSFFCGTAQIQSGQAFFPTFHLFPVALLYGQRHGPKLDRKQEQNLIALEWQAQQRMQAVMMNQIRAHILLHVNSTLV